MIMNDMIYKNIKNRYHFVIPSTGASNDILKNFHDCSYDDFNGKYVVDDCYLPCIKFDKLASCLYGNLYHACDSLHFSDKLKRLLFIEFKNRPYDENDYSKKSTITKIIEQAGDTIFLHCDICKSIPDYDKIQSDFAAVISADKNESINALSAQEIMLIVSGRTIDGSAADSTRLILESLINNYLSVHYPLINYSYQFIGVVKSTQFSAFLSRYLP